MKVLKRILISLLIFLVVACGFVGNYFYNFALNPAIDKSKVVNQDSDGEVVDSYYEEAKVWFEENKKETTMQSVTKNNLVGYSFENKDSNKWVVVVHGYTSEAKKMASYIKHFYELGYNVFAPDLIAHGKSGGDFYTMGGFDSDDLVAWTKKISSEKNNPEIAIFGISMGSSTVMNSLNKDLPNNVKIAIADSGYVNLTKEFTYQLKKLFNLPYFPVIPSASAVTKVRAGYFLSDVDATEALKANKRPILLLHGEEDGFVPLEHGKEAYELITSEKEFHSFKGAKHVKAERIYREQYWNIIKNFLDKNFK